MLKSQILMWKKCVLFDPLVDGTCWKIFYSLVIPIENWIEEEALKGALRLKANGHWINMPMVNKKGNLTSQTKIIDTKLNDINLSKDQQNMITPSLNLDTRYIYA